MGKEEQMHITDTGLLFKDSFMVVPLSFFFSGDGDGMLGSLQMTSLSGTCLVCDRRLASLEAVVLVVHIQQVKIH